jgi:uncharacterized repeat protein (TIGR03803 family)
VFRIYPQRKPSKIAAGMILALLVVSSSLVQSQTFTVLHNFTGGADGSTPEAGVTMDASGNLYGTAGAGGETAGCGGLGCGTVYKLARRSSGWIFSPLYSFTGGNDGAFPVARVIPGANGTLYGSTFAGGNAYGVNGAGVVFNLRPPAHLMGSVFSPWTETVLHTFAGDGDGANPTGDLLFDHAGNLYGTASCTTAICRGSVYELKPSNGGWMETILYAFSVGGDGYYPIGGVIFDNAGNLYGVTNAGGIFWGTVFQLIPSGSGWTETVLHNFQSASDGGFPVGGLILDSSGNLYGTTGAYGPQGGGTVFELSPSGSVSMFGLLYGFHCSGDACYSLPGPQASLFMDSAGNLFGTTTQDGAHGYGNVFKLTPQAVGWTYTSLHDFTGGNDGALPYSSVLEDANGNLFGTAAEGGSYNKGVVWEITP